MKNKNKSKKVQKYINQVKQQTEQKVGGKKKGHEEPQKSKKQLAAEKAAEFNLIFKPVVDKKTQVKAGVDPKSVLCQYFKAGTCTKGARCKFSHDLSVERKGEKIDIYTDRRDISTEETNETMEDWDENKLREVVAKKAGKNPPTTTDIVCKYFLDAIESKKYGWFWECPNGGTKCQYRHALPPGYVFVGKKKKEVEEEEEKVPLEDLIEEERKGLTGGTPLTLELFLKWKEDRRLAREKAAAERESAIKAGKINILSGRELFSFNPDLVAGDDDSAYDEDELRREKAATEKEEEENDAKGKELADDHPEAAAETDTPAEKEAEAGNGEGSSSGVAVDEQLFAAEAVEDLPEFDD